MTPRKRNASEPPVLVSTDRNEIYHSTNNRIDYFAGLHDSHPSSSAQGDGIVFERDASDFLSSAIYIMQQGPPGVPGIVQLVWFIALEVPACESHYSRSRSTRA